MPGSVRLRDDPGHEPSTDSSSAVDPNAPPPTTTTTAVSSTANAAAAVGQAVAAPTPTNIANAVDAVGNAANAVNAATSSTGSPSSAGSKSVTFDTQRKLEYVDVYVDMGNPTGQQALVPYLMKPKDWMLVGCEMTSLTSKHYRFMKVSTNDGKELPSVDIFSPRR